MTDHAQGLGAGLGTRPSDNRKRARPERVQAAKG